jgi:hypothetical protein
MKTLAKIKNNHYVRFFMSEPFSSFTLSTIAKHGLLAGFGALAHAINAHRTGKTKGFLDFCLLTIMSSFSGVIFALVALHTFDNQYITLAAAGSGGFLGVEGLTLLSIKIRDVLANTIAIKK